ncbi:CPG_1a_G0054500.mRNA.1.CDS.1 [Saccharomyces cerevisiae]|nr:CPG_1a_G0054500.mRNA.1.CDS.1 [Saccharomyces cerevisiae]CAI7478552.1 CPG_1a_G0054500.mRNA.1.CDS.1 [Saccharomyces cerevisiae]
MDSQVPNNNESLNRFNDIIQSLPARTRLTICSLCLLDNISTQLLRFLILNANSPNIIAVLTDQTAFLSSGETEIFQTLVKLFKQIRMIYHTRSPLLSVHDVAPGLWFPNSPPPLILRGHEAFIITAIRKANLLTFLLTSLNCLNYGFELLQSIFLDIFCPNTNTVGNNSLEQSGKFLKSQAILYLDLKTQAYIAGLKEFQDETNEISLEKKQELLDLIFPSNLADILVQRRTGDSGDITLLTPSEKDFVERCDRRRENLKIVQDFNSLTQSYEWAQFIRELLDYCNKNMGPIIWGRKGRGKSPLYDFDVNEFDPQVLFSTGTRTVEFMDDQNQPSSASAFLSTARPNHYSTHTPTTDVSSKNPAITQSIVDAAVAASMSNSSSGPHSSHNNSSNSNNNGSIGLRKPKAKRTWSKEEEEALVEGLKEVGPSWSKILDLYGPGGKITENLKNRTQVQLKDKARNWKLQYLKSGKPLPDYLIKVTGNLEKIYKAKKKFSQSPNSSTIMEQNLSQHPSSAASATEDTQTHQEDSHGQNSDNMPSNGLFGNSTSDNTGFDPHLEDGM